MLTKTRSFPVRRPALVYAMGMGLSLLTALNSFAQINPSLDGRDKDNQPIFTVAEQPPQFPGGIDSLQTYLRTTLHYPPAAKAAGVSGQVVTTFIVRSDGQITDIQVLKGLKRGCTEEAVRVISAMPRWQPAKQANHLVNFKYNLPISFGL